MKNSNTITIAVLVLIVAFGAWATNMRGTRAGHPSPLPTLSSIPDFALKDQNGRTIKRSDLLGHAFVLDFMFTTCTSYCTDMTGALNKIRTALGPQSEVRTISITVDPDHDTPNVLRRYAEAHQAVNPRWLFLTGDKRTIGSIMQALYLAPSGDPSQLNPALHSSRLILVDAEGRVRGYYEQDDLDARQRLAGDARSLDSKH